jgi:hypothetical protein
MVGKDETSPKSPPRTRRGRAKRRGGGIFYHTTLQTVALWSRS